MQPFQIDVQQRFMAGRCFVLAVYQKKFIHRDHEPIQDLQHEMKLDVIHPFLKINGKRLAQNARIDFFLRKAFAQSDLANGNPIGFHDLHRFLYFIV